MRSPAWWCVLGGVALWLAAPLFSPSEASARPTITIVALGDSTTAGSPGFHSPLEAPPDGAGDPRSQYGYWITQRHPEWRVLNKGVWGQRSDQMLARFDRDVVAESPDVVIILAGINDLYQGLPVDAVKWQLQQLYERAQLYRIPVVACTILPYNEATAEALTDMQQLNQWIQETAAKRGLAFCDTAAAVENPQFPGLLRGTPDGLHPDVEVYRHIGEALTPVLERVLEAAR